MFKGLKQKVKLVSKKFFTVLAAISILSAACGGGGQNQPKQVVLNFWDPFESTENFQDLFSEYQQKNPNVQIVYTKKDINTYATDLINALAAGTGPDIYAVNNSWLPQYYDKISPAPEKVWPFTQYKKDFVDVAVEDLTLEQKIYAAPLYVDSLALYYNIDILGSNGIATPAKTWSELSSHVQKIRRTDQTGYFKVSGTALGTSSNINRSMDILYLMMLQKGALPYSRDKSEPTFGQNIQKDGQNTNPGLDALSYYTSFANSNSVNYTWNSKSDYSIDAFANGRTAYLYSYSYVADTIKQKNPNLNFDIAPVPQPSLEKPAVNYASYWAHAVSRQSQNADYAWDLLKFLTSKDSLDKYYAKNKLPSSRKDLISLQILDPDIGVFANANLTAKPFYKPDQAKMDGIFAKMIDNVILTGFKPLEALTQAEAQAATLGHLRN